MRSNLFHFLLIIMVVVGCSAPLINLGHGYSIINRLQEIPVDIQRIESKTSSRDFYYRSLKLGPVGQFSIAPSGRFALFESAGRLQLFTAESLHLQDKTGDRFSIPRNFEWREPAGMVIVTFYDEAETRVIRLNESSD